MSDDRKDAEQELANAMKDSLGSSLSSSFNLPPPEPKHETETTAPVEPETLDKTESDEPSAPIPGMEEWKDTYDSYLEKWQAESAIAREKAEKTRKRIEDEHAAAAKAKKDEENFKKKAEQAKVAEKARQEKLKKELEEVRSTKKRGQSSTSTSSIESREQKVKEAWEMVKAAGPGVENKEVVTDARGVMDADIKAGQVQVEGEKREPIKPLSYDPTTSSEPLPPSAQYPSPPSPLPEPSSSQTLSRHSATSQAWEEVSISPSSAEDLSPPPSGSSSDDVPPPRTRSSVPVIGSSSSTEESTRPDGPTVPSNVKDFPSHQIHPASVSSTPVPQIEKSKSSPAPQPQPQPQPASSSAVNPQSQSLQQRQNTPPAQPPSLTLSIFSAPDQISFSKVLAIVGINVVLPFINGVMLGFGEIFAREVVKNTRQWWRSGKSLFSRGRDRDGDLNGRGYARGVAGVGLSGSGGF